MNIVTKMCIESATAKVIIIVGALADGGVKPMPIHPPTPIATKILGIITIRIETVAEIDLKSTKLIIIMTRYIAGTKVARSFIEAS